MSTHWGFVCLKCEVASEHWLNHGDQVLGALLQGYGAVRHERPDIAWMRLRILEAGEGPGEFIYDHWGHQLALGNEYGDRRRVVAPPVCAIVDCNQIATRRIVMRPAGREPDGDQLVAVAVCDVDQHPTRNDRRVQP